MRVEDYDLRDGEYVMTAKQENSDIHKGRKFVMK